MARDRGSLLKTVALLPFTPLAYPLGLLYGWWQRRETIVGMLRLGGRALHARSPSRRVWLSAALAAGGVVVLWYGVPWVWSHLPTLPGPRSSDIVLTPLTRIEEAFGGTPDRLAHLMIPAMGSGVLVGVAVRIYLWGSMPFQSVFIGIALSAIGLPWFLSLMR